MPLLKLLSHRGTKPHISRRNETPSQLCNTGNCAEEQNPISRGGTKPPLDCTAFRLMFQRLLHTWFNKNFATFSRSMHKLFCGSCLSLMKFFKQVQNFFRHKESRSSIEPRPRAMQKDFMASRKPWYDQLETSVSSK